MLVIKSLNEAEHFVSRQKRLGNDVEWEGYDIVFYRPDERAMTSKHGVWRRQTSEWAYKNVSPVNDDGTWDIDWRNVRRATKDANI